MSESVTHLISLFAYSSVRVVGKGHRKERNRKKLRRKIPLALGLNASLSSLLKPKFIVESFEPAAIRFPKAIILKEVCDLIDFANTELERWQSGWLTGGPTHRGQLLQSEKDSNKRIERVPFVFWTLASEYSCIILSAQRFLAHLDNSISSAFFTLYSRDGTGRAAIVSLRGPNFKCVCVCLTGS